MATLGEVKEILYKRFIDNWDITQFSSYTLDNEQFSPNINKPWVRVVIRNQESIQETLGKKGARKFTHVGVVFVQIFTPRGTGTKLADHLTIQARNIFEGQNIFNTSIRFIEVTSKELGIEGPWYQVIVEANFEYTEIK